MRTIASGVTVYIKEARPPPPMKLIQCLSYISHGAGRGGRPKLLAASQADGLHFLQVQLGKDPS